MKRSDCLFERVSRLGMGIAMLFIALGLIIIGQTVWPFLGMALAVPALLAAAYFVTAPGSPECRIG